YRLRVENTLYGSVLVSTDGGLHYTLIGRVLHPAKTFVADRSDTRPGVILRSSGFGLAFSIAPDRTLKLRPYQSVATMPKKGKNRTPALHAPLNEPCAIVTNLAPDLGLFGDLLPPAQGAAGLQTGSR